MSLIKLINGTPSPYSLSQLKRDNPNVSFPTEPRLDTLAEYGVFPVRPTERPEDTDTQRAVEAKPELVDGLWTQAWRMEDIPPAELEERAASLAMRNLPAAFLALEARVKALEARRP